MGNDMQITAEAAALIGILTKNSPDCQALRIDLRADSDSLSMSLTSEPEIADTVIGDHGVLIYLGPEAAERLQSQTLHAGSGNERSAFYLK